MPTGDPRMPEDVRRAKHLRYRLTELAEIGDREQGASIVEDVLPTESDDIDGSTSDDEEKPQSGMPLSSMSTAQRTDITRSQERTLLPQQIVKERKSREKEEDLTSVLKMIMVQEQVRREEDLPRRKKDRRYDLERRCEDSKRHERLTQMIIKLHGKPPQNNSSTSYDVNLSCSFVV